MMETYYCLLSSLTTLHLGHYFEDGRMIIICLEFCIIFLSHTDNSATGILYRKCDPIITTIGVNTLWAMPGGMMLHFKIAISCCKTQEFVWTYTVLPGRNTTNWHVPCTGSYSWLLSWGPGTLRSSNWKLQYRTCWSQMHGWSERSRSRAGASSSSFTPR